ncbi:MAG: HAD hydrolase-like protein, partial [Planctomycetes bacterium]|nr:HAD hydrolase-like protein [Planctomycetota bacterium]
LSSSSQAPAWERTAPEALPHHPLVANLCFATQPFEAPLLRLPKNNLAHYVLARDGTSKSTSLNSSSSSGQALRLIRPGCGAFVALLETATGIRAFSVGKPSPVMMRAARKELDLATAETIVIGDTMETDILGGVQMAYRTVLVLTGSTQESDLSRFAYRPDLIVPSVAELCDLSLLLEEQMSGVGY